MWKADVLVPSFELCKKIPPDRVMDTAFTWVKYKGKRQKLATINEVPIAPDCILYAAPTMQELLDELPFVIVETVIKNSKTVYSILKPSADGSKQIYTTKPATELLKIWLKWNKDEEKERRDKSK